MGLQTLKSRSEFLAVRGGARASVPVCLIESRRRPGGALTFEGPRFGFTVTKKLGNAVTRNRIRRRLKGAIAAISADHAEDGFDYVLVARSAAFDRPFEDMRNDLIRAFNVLHKTPSRGDQGLDKTRQQVKKPTQPRPA